MGGCLLAEQLAVEPPLLPLQDQFHGPEPLTAEAVPISQSPPVGALDSVWPLANPQLPLTGAACLFAEQLAVDPPLLPLQDQFHGPEPLTAEAVPVSQRPPVGVLVSVCPLAKPQLPLMAVGEYVNVAVTFRAAVRLIVQLPVPVQSPLQPEKKFPAAGAAANTTLVPLLKLAVQVPPQLIPDGELVTVPLPVPDLATFKSKETKACPPRASRTPPPSLRP